MIGALKLFSWKKKNDQSVILVATDFETHRFVIWAFAIRLYELSMKMTDSSGRMYRFAETQGKCSTWYAVFPFRPLEKLDKLFSCLGVHLCQGFSVCSVNGEQVYF